MMQKELILPSPVKSGIGFGVFELVRAVTDAAIAVVVLLVSAALWQQPFGPAESVVAAMAFMLQYRGRRGLGVPRNQVVSSILKRWAITVIVLLSIGLLTHFVASFNEYMLLTWIAVTPMAQIAAHWLGPYVYAPIVRMRGLRRSIVVGSTELGRSFAKTINRDPLAYERVIAFFDDREIDRIPPEHRRRLAGRLDAVGDFVRANNIDQIFIALPIAAQPRILKMIDDLHNSTASIWFVADLARFQPVQPSISSISGFPVLAVCESPFRGMPGTIKRILDIVIASIALILTAPVMLLAALAILLTSRGPVIFKQTRYGLEGGEITVYKFRSMTVTENGSDQYEQVSRGDARVTRVGAFLRKTSLDELPQFINVLQGRMSVVGPRPHAVAVNQHYRDQIPSYMVRHKVRPGITGWAQIHGYRGGDDLPSMTKRIEFDLHYLRNWSIWLDLKILMRTIAVIFKDPSAY
ncbi:MAG: undecaprenyl-phosphate glucose phosphotransferase [Burkholderiaceae bacterium]